MVRSLSAPSLKDWPNASKRCSLPHCAGPHRRSLQGNRQSDIFRGSFVQTSRQRSCDAEPGQVFAAFAPPIRPQSPLRKAITAAYRRPETECLPPLVEAAKLLPR
nr:hypothetical protein [Bradyrhizobium manausense]